MSKLTEFIKNNLKVLVAFIIGGILFGGVTYVVATEISSEYITYTENSQSNVQGALNDLYNKADKWGYKYWGVYDKTYYSSTSAPSVLYSSYSDVVGSNSSYSLMRSIFVDGTPRYHEVCMYYNSKIFCIDSDYYANHSSGTSDANTNAINALKSDLTEVFGENPSYCSTTSQYCQLSGNFRMYIDSSFVQSIQGSRNCIINSNGARCSP